MSNVPYIAPKVDRRINIRDVVTGVDMPIQVITTTHPMLVRVIFNGYSFTMTRSMVQELAGFFDIEEDRIAEGEAI